MASVSSGKAPRVLACVLCQHRKIKCDRKTPCSNCVKANVTCTPSTPAPARKRRRPNQDLQQRLARCEELLQEYATAKPASSPSEPSTEDDAWKSQGKLIHDDGGLRFMDSYLWAEVHDELRAMREIVDHDDKDDDTSYCTPSEGRTPDQNTALVFGDGSASSLDELHPEPGHAFRLWQTFLDRVNPLTKVIHVPTVQPLLVEAATSQANISREHEALLFSIYTMGTVALTDQECLSLLGYTKEEAFKRFSQGVRVALTKIGILHRCNLVLLQAMVLYLTSLSGRYDRHAAWILNGVVVRIAQKMGLHKDGESLGLSPFETEMRRRIWWQIILLDATYAFMSGLGQSLVPRHWDTKQPRNINDADMFPTMKSVESREGPTDMVFCLTTCELAKIMLEYPGLEPVSLQNELGSGDYLPSVEIENARRRIDMLDQSLKEIHAKYCDLSMGPVHELAMQTRPVMVKKLKEIVRPPREQAEWGTEILTPKDNLFKIAVTMGEFSIHMYTLTERRGYFLWYEMAHFQIEGFLYMVGRLDQRNTGQLVERAWNVVERMYHFHTEMFDLSIKPHAALAVFTTRAWRKREEFLRATTGSAPEKPYYIHRLQSALGPEGEIKDEQSFEQQLPETISAVEKTTSNAVDVPWDQMLGFMDSSTLDWDMFGNGPQINYAAFGNGMGTQSSLNGWM